MANMYEAHAGSEPCDKLVALTYINIASRKPKSSQITYSHTTEYIFWSYNTFAGE